MIDGTIYQHGGKMGLRQKNEVITSCKRLLPDQVRQTLEWHEFPKDIPPLGRILYTMKGDGSFRYGFFNPENSTFSDALYAVPFNATHWAESSYSDFSRAVLFHVEEGNPKFTDDGFRALLSTAERAAAIEAKEKA